LSVSIDWFDLYLKQSITNGITPAAILQDIAQFGYLVTRAAPDAANPNLPGRITSINQHYLNLGGVKIQGLDTNWQFSPSPTSVGRFHLTMSGTYYIKYDVQQTDGSYAGFISNQLL